MRLLHSPDEAAQWLRDRDSNTLTADSRQVGAGDGFIAWPGAATDGRQHVASALARGAAACLVEAAGVQAFGFEGEAVAAYAGLRPATGPIADAFFGQPSATIEVLAVTGTNGKTSTTWWLAQALSAVPGPDSAPRGCAVVGTLGIGVPPDVQYNGLTTPDPVLLQARLRAFADAGLAACAIEASSIGLAEGRLDGTRVRVAVFTNFTQDHLDYHGSMQAYWAAKASLFGWPGLQAAVINIDDEKGATLASRLRGGALDVWTTSSERAARLRALDIGHAPQGLRFTVTEGERSESVQTRLIGQYNVSNLLAVIGVLRTRGVTLTQAAQACSALLPVPGRMERIDEPGCPLVAVDYAHTPDALDKALAALRPLALQRGGALWCVFGCGGDRDAVKRPLMAAVAENNADRVVVTSDNPRSEKPENIISQILLGLSRRDRVDVEADRARAIEKAVRGAAASDVVLLAGKGHENYQEIEGVKRPFDDRTVARAALRRRKVAA